MGPNDTADAYDVPDSTDWMGTPLAGLMPVEAAFRCHVCKDFYNSPMITSCNHTFCSLCIRRCLQADGKCPLCRKNDQETKLRGNWALREAVDAFVASRTAILEYARKPVIPVTASPKRKARELNDEDIQEPTSKRTRMSTRSSARRGAEATSAMAQEEVNEPDHEEPADVYTPDDGLVACPICQTRMKEADINKHLDTSCSWKPSYPKTQPPTPKKISSQANFLTTQAKSSEQAKAPERLPALAYSMLKDQSLRKKLIELGINSYGSRAHLERRHKEWVTLWNANCDSAHPKTRSELLQDLDNWERTVGTGTRSLVYGHQAPQVKDKNFDGSAWASKHDDSFKDLIANARKSKQKAEEKAKGSTSPAPAPRQLEKAELPSEPQTSSTTAPMVAPNAEVEFEAEKAALEERWRQSPPDFHAMPYAEFMYSTFGDDSDLRNGRPELEQKTATEQPAARTGSVASTGPAPAMSAGTDNRPDSAAQPRNPRIYMPHQTRPVVNSTVADKGLTAASTAGPSSRPDYGAQFPSSHSYSQPTTYGYQGPSHYPRTESIATSTAMSNVPIPAAVTNGYQLPPILQQGVNEPVRSGPLPAIAHTGISSQPTPASQRGIHQLPSFSSSFDNYMGKRSSQEPAPSLTEHSPPR